MGPEYGRQPRTCQKAHDFCSGSRLQFGKAKGSLDLFGTNPRGSFSDWESQTVFTDPHTCGLRATLEGDKQVLKEAQDLMIQRLGRLDPQNCASHIHRGQVPDDGPETVARRLRDSGSQNAEEAALDEWTNTFSQADSGNQERAKLQAEIAPQSACLTLAPS